MGEEIVSGPGLKGAGENCLGTSSPELPLWTGLAKRPDDLTGLPYSITACTLIGLPTSIAESPQLRILSPGQSLELP